MYTHYIIHYNTIPSQLILVTLHNLGLPRIHENSCQVAYKKGSDVSTTFPSPTQASKRVAAL